MNEYNEKFAISLKKKKLIAYEMMELLSKFKSRIFIWWIMLTIKVMISFNLLGQSIISYLNMGHGKIFLKILKSKDII